MKFKPGVEVSGVAIEVWYALGVADTLRQNLVVTSLRDSTHNPHSLHPKGLAADLRVHDLTADEQSQFFGALRAKLEPLGFDVILERLGATAATTDVHVHLEFDPKPGENFIVRTA